MSQEENNFLNFVLSHHSKDERGAKCIKFDKYYLCARCSGAFLGVLAGLFTILFFSFDMPYYLTFPAPAFIDWGGVRLHLLPQNKLVNFLSGILLGFAVPYFYSHVLSFDPLAVLFALIYLFIFVIFLVVGDTKKK